MSSEVRESKLPRSLTLTFAETHPWEMLVRDRLVSLPRGYLKRFLLHLIESSGLDLHDEETFRSQVEMLLVTRHRGPGLAAPEFPPPVVKAAATSVPAAHRQAGAVHRDTPPPALPQRAHTAANEESEEDAHREARPTPAKGDSGFGALEL